MLTLLSCPFLCSMSVFSSSIFLRYYCKPCTKSHMPCVLWGIKCPLVIFVLITIIHNEHDIENFRQDYYYGSSKLFWSSSVPTKAPLRTRLFFTLRPILLDRHNAITTAHGLGPGTQMQEIPVYWCRILTISCKRWPWGLNLKMMSWWCKKLYER